MRIVKLFLALFAFPLVFISCEKTPDELLNNQPPKVDAGRDTTITLSKLVNSIQLSGSATDTDGTVVGYIWSQVSGPSESTIVSPGSAKTLVKGLADGDYVFQLMAVDNEGATGVNSVSVNLISPQVITVNLNPSNNPTETVINSLEPGNNDRLQELPASYWTNGGSPVEVRSLFKLDLSGIPSGATIVSAKLSLYAVPNPVNGDGVHAHYGSYNAIYIRRITGDWSVSDLSWNNQPATSQVNELELPATNNCFQNYINLDVTDLVNDMLLNGNYGMMLQLKDLNLYNIQNFASSKHTDASKHPKLILEYTN